MGWKKYTKEQLKEIWASEVASKKTALAYQPWVAQFIISQTSASPAKKAAARKTISEHAKARGQTASRDKGNLPEHNAPPPSVEENPEPSGPPAEKKSKRRQPADIVRDEPEFEEDDPPDQAFRKTRDFQNHTRAGQDRLEQEATGRKLGLTPKQILLCREWLVDRNGARAARAAGFSDVSAKEMASRLLTKANVKEFIQYLEAPRLKALDIDAEWLLQEYKNMAGVNLEDFVTIGEDGLVTPDFSRVTRAQMAGLAGIEVIELPPMEEDGPVPLKIKIKLADKMKAMDMLARRLGVMKEEAPAQVNINMDSKEIARRVAFLLRKESARKMPDNSDNQNPVK